jgi:hypothetical protein
MVGTDHHGPVLFETDLPILTPELFEAFDAVAEPESKRECDQW